MSMKNDEQLLSSMSIFFFFTPHVLAMFSSPWSFLFDIERLSVSTVLRSGRGVSVSIWVG